MDFLDIAAKISQNLGNFEILARMFSRQKIEFLKFDEVLRVESCARGAKSNSDVGERLCRSRPRLLLRVPQMDSKKASRCVRRTCPGRCPQRLITKKATRGGSGCRIGGRLDTQTPPHTHNTHIHTTHIHTTHIDTTHTHTHTATYTLMYAHTHTNLRKGNE